MLISPIKQAYRIFKQERYKALNAHKHASASVNLCFKWLSPGLFVKRWLLISITGVILTSLGLAIWAQLTPVARLMEISGTIIETIASIIPNHISGPLAILLGLFLVFWGQLRTLGSISEVLQPDKEQKLVNLLLEHRRLNRGPKIVAIGGGTGLSTLLRGLKRYSSNITAIVTVADDGGSSGRLRREIGVLPPGDIRNCLAALAAEEQLLTELFQYRFEAGEGLNGHSFGNLFLTAMSEITGDLERAVAASSKVLAVKGRVLPATLCDMRLWAEMYDGRIVQGESNIPKAGGKIRTLGCDPPHPPALPAALKAIKEADYIIIGPGSLYTSVIPNLLVPAIARAIAAATVPRIYVCNVMTQPGETGGYTVSDHINAIDSIYGCPLFDAVLVNRSSPSETALRRYAKENSHPVYLDREAVKQLKRRIVRAEVIEEDATGYVRHNPDLLAHILLQWYTHNHRSKPNEVGSRA